MNRDGTGSPKTAVYGGVTRARVSSQSWKKAMRDMFRDEKADRRLFSPEELGHRTKWVIDELANRIEEIAKKGPEDARELANKIWKLSGVQKNKEESENAQNEKEATLFFISEKQLMSLAELSKDPEALDKSKVKNALEENPSIDMALFGRMVANNTSYNVDAAAQVAHSISTHRVSNEYDYFTAIDDLADKYQDHAGSAYMGTTEFYSATLYRYATVASHCLLNQLGEASGVAKAIRGFVEAFVLSKPKGMENSFANHTHPDAVLVVLRTDQPISFVGAFEKPVPASESGYMMASADALVKYARETYSTWLQEPIKAIAVGDLLSGIAEQMPLPGLLETVENAIHDLLAGEMS
jgi:CRISPR system Cascade subunit CasC